MSLKDIEFNNIMSRKPLKWSLANSINFEELKNSAVKYSQQAATVTQELASAAVTKTQETLTQENVGWAKNKTTEYVEFKVMDNVVLDCITFNIPSYCYNEAKNFSDIGLRYHLCKDRLAIFYTRIKETIYYDGRVEDEHDIGLLDSIGCYESLIRRWNETVCIEKILVKSEE